MKKILVIFLFNCAYGQTNSDISVNQFLTRVFISLQAHDVNIYIKAIISESYFKEKYWNSKKGIIINDTIKKQVDSILHSAYSEMFPSLIQQYHKIYKSNPKTPINWEQTKLDSIKSDSITEKQTTIYNSKIYFRNIESTKFYIINIMNTEKYKGNFTLYDMYVPYINYGATNRYLTRNIKTKYIIACVNEVKKVTYKNFFNGKTPEKYCECRYNQMSEESDGVKRIVKGDIGFYPNKPKSK